jgi:hypothetical protein
MMPEFAGGGTGATPQRRPVPRRWRRGRSTPSSALHAEDLVHRHLQRGDHAVGLCGHADHRHQLHQLGLGHALGPGRGGVRVDAVFAAMRHRYRDIQHLLGPGVQRAGRHHLLDAVPGAAQQRRVVRQRAPEIVDVVGAAGGADIGEDGRRRGGELVVGKQLHGGHR